MSSNLKELFYERYESFIFAILLKADSIQDSLFKLYALKTILSQTKEKFSKEELVILLEDFPLAIPENRILELTESLLILNKENDKYIFKDEFFLKDELKSKGRKFPKALQDIKITSDWIRELIFKSDTKETPWTIRTVQDAIAKGLGWMHWGIQTALNPDSGLKNGLPPFWICNEEYGDQAMGFLQASTSSSDTVAALAQSYFHICSYEKLNLPDKKQMLEAGLKFVLNCQITKECKFDLHTDEHEYNLGGFMAFDDQPDAYFPTVDASWDAVIALSGFYDIYDQITNDYGSLSISKNEIKDAIISGVKFLLKMQLKEGAWGVYKYPDDRAPIFSHEFSTAYTIIALFLSSIIDIYDSPDTRHLKDKIDKALLKAYEFIKEKAGIYDSYKIWAPFYSDSPEDYNVSELLKSTCWTCSGLLAIYRHFEHEHLREEIKPLLENFVLFADKYWSLDYQKIARFEFRVPQKEKLSDNFASWKNRLDVTMAILLLDIYNQGFEPDDKDKLNIVFSKSLWNKIEGTVNNILHEQHPEHGHWNDPVDNRPLAAAGMMAMQVLQYYLKAVKNML